MFVYALGAAGALLAVGFGLGRLTGGGRASAMLAGSARPVRARRCRSACSAR